MTFKKILMPLTAVALVALMAVSLVGQTRRAEAAISAVTLTAPVQAAGLTETWTVNFTTGAAIPIGGKVTVVFPAGFVIPTAPTIVTTNGGGTGFAAATTATASTSAQTVTITTAGTTPSVAGAHTLTIAGIKNPSAGAAYAPTVNTDQTGDTAAVAATAIGIWDLTIAKSPSTVAADGASTVGLTITASNAAANTLATGQITFAIDNGTFTGTATDAGTDFVGAATTIATDGKSATSVNQVGVGVTAVTGLQVKAPTAASTGTIQIKVTPAGGGQAVLVGITTISFTAAPVAPGAVTSGSVTTPTGTLGVSATGAATVTATFIDANGNAPIPGATLSVTTSLGVLSGPTNGTCTNQSCSGTVPATGVFSVTLTGGGVAGTGTITFSVGSVTATKALTVSGSVDTLAVAVQSDSDGAGAALTFVSAATPNATTFTVVGTNVGGRLSVTAKDSAGNRVPGAAVTATFSPASCGAAPAVTTAGTATTDVMLGITSASLSAPAGTACTVTVTSGTKTATTTFTVGGTFATTSTLAVNAVDMAAVSTQSVTVTVKDSSGALIGDGVSVTLVVSAGAVAAPTATTVNGIATFTYVSPGTAQNVNLTAVSGSVTASKAIAVGGATPPPATGGGVFSGATIAPTGLTIVSFTGTTAQLTTAGQAAKVISTSATVNGKLLTFVIGAPDFVNVDFVAAFPTGLNNVLVIVKTGS